MKVRISTYNGYYETSVTQKLYFEDLLKPRGCNAINPYDLIGKTITHIEESDEVEGALILTLE